MRNEIHTPEDVVDSLAGLPGFTPEEAAEADLALQELDEATDVPQTPDLGHDLDLLQETAKRVEEARQGNFLNRGLAKKVQDALRAQTEAAQARSRSQTRTQVGALVGAALTLGIIAGLPYIGSTISSLFSSENGPTSTTYDPGSGERTYKGNCTGYEIGVNESVGLGPNSVVRGDIQVNGQNLFGDAQKTGTIFENRATKPVRVVAPYGACAYVGPYTAEQQFLARQIAVMAESFNCVKGCDTVNLWQARDSRNAPNGVEIVPNGVVAILGRK